MFNAKLFSEILQKISNSYSSITDFANNSKVNRTYLSKYINMKLVNPPTPKLLEKIAISSHGITTYAELMEICGYLETISYNKIKKAEFDNIKMQLYNRGFSQPQIDKITYYCMKKYTGQDPEMYKDMEEFESFLKTLSPDDAEFVLNFKTNLVLGVAKQYEKLADKTQSIYDRSEHLLDVSLPNFTSSNLSFIPLYGEISAGQPNWAEECIEGTLPIDPDLMGIVNPEEHYFLRVNGESMNKIIKNGAFALIHKQDYVNNGEIAVVLVNGYDATLKRFSKEGDIVVLTPESNDASFKQQIYTKDTPIQVIGKYVGKMEINK